MYIYLCVCVLVSVVQNWREGEVFGLISSIQSQKIKENLFGSEIENKRLHGWSIMCSVYHHYYETIRCIHLLGKIEKSYHYICWIFNFLFYENKHKQRSR